LFKIATQGGSFWDFHICMHRITMMKFSFKGLLVNTDCWHVALSLSSSLRNVGDSFDWM
jgi:hypothetical protein